MNEKLLNADILITAAAMIDEMSIEKAEIFGRRGLCKKKEKETVLGEVTSELTKRQAPLRHDGLQRSACP